MKPVFRLLSYLALALTVLAPLLVWNDVISVETNKVILLVSMILWFGTAVIWIKHEKPE